MSRKRKTDAVLRPLDVCEARQLRVFAAIALYMGARPGAILELP